MRKALAVAIGLALCAPALAQESVRPPVKGQVSKGKQRPRPAQRLDFTKGDLVEAGVANAGGELVGGRRAPRMSRLIPVRTDFLPELLKSAEQL